MYEKCNRWQNLSDRGLDLPCIILFPESKNRKRKGELMIKTRLVGLLSHAKKYIVYTILWQWAALLSQVLAVFSIADLLEKVVYQNVTTAVVNAQ